MICKREIECPNGHEFVAEEYVGGSCPVCGERYSWDDQYDEESGDEWCWTIWESREGTHP